MRRVTYEALFNSLLDWVDDHLSEELTLQRVADKAGYSRWHLQRVFREENGMPLARYIRRRRLTVIYNAMLNSNWREGLVNLPEYAYFNDQQTLCRAFKAQFGFPPTSVGQCEPPEGSLQPKIRLIEPVMPGNKKPA